MRPYLFIKMESGIKFYPQNKLTLGGTGQNTEASVRGQRASNCSL